MIPEIELVVNPYTGLTEQEVWKDIHGYEGLYQVSNYGRVNSLEKKKRRYSQLLTPTIGNHGYKYVSLVRNGTICKQLIHRLVAIAFLSNFESKATVNHKTGVKTINYSWQLEWATPKEQIYHAISNNLMNQRGEHNSNAVITDVEAIIIRDALKAGFKGVEIAKYFKISKSLVSAINRNIRHTI